MYFVDMNESIPQDTRAGWQIPNSGFVLPDILREDCRVARPAGAGHRNPTYEELPVV
jgi:hypothetical protein